MWYAPLPTAHLGKSRQRIDRKPLVRPLDRLTECAPLELFEADQAARDREEGFVDVGATLVADAEAAVLVEPGDRAFDDPTLSAEA
jgi:hypothetical protein